MSNKIVVEMLKRAASYGDKADEYLLRTAMHSKDAREKIVAIYLLSQDGGAGSGNWGHKGRPGEIGGSGKGGGIQYRGGRSDIAYHSSKNDWMNGLKGEKQHEAQNFIRRMRQNFGTEEELKHPVEQVIMQQESSGSEKIKKQLVDYIAEARSWESKKDKLIENNLDDTEKKLLKALAVKYGIDKTFEDDGIPDENGAEKLWEKEDYNFWLDMKSKAMGGYSSGKEAPDELQYLAGLKQKKANAETEPELADPAEVKDIIDKKTQEIREAISEYNKLKPNYYFTKPSPETQKMLDEANKKIKEARSDLEAYKDKARKNPEYFDKIYESDTRETLEKYNKVDKKQITKYNHKMTEDEIVGRLGGGDKTNGSCASLVLAYAGCKSGYDVLDFRGGKSQRFFSKGGLRNFMRELEGVEKHIESEHLDYVNAKNLLKKTMPGKQYVLCTGHHAAVVRKTDEGKLQYLELQSSNSNGWKDFSQKLDYTLFDRFGCAKKKLNDSIMVELDTMIDHPEVLRICEYVNTNEGEQKKGASGYAK